MFQDIRKQYNKAVLKELNIPDNPLDLLKLWLQEAIESEEPEPTAMTLSTVDKRSQVHARVVLLKELDAHKLSFYSNYDSDKAKQIAHNPSIALSFFWPLLERQVRICGKAHMATRKQSAEYFATRPYESQIGAWASPQSKKIDSPDYLLKQFEYYKNLYPSNVPIPQHWGGYNVLPHSIEFWQGRPNRLHDRLLFTSENETWTVQRLAP